MPRPLPRERWLAETAARFAALDAWRQAHPTATWAEIEAAVDAQLGPLRAQLLGDTAMASEATDLGGRRRVCPDCGARLHAAGARRRRLRSDQDELIALERWYARCPACGTGLFPPSMRNWGCSRGP
jgi:NADH pyrophosphatase NudC (nudix superfamily)